MSSVPRSGFETKLISDGYAKYVYVEAIDRHDQVLGTSKLIETLAAEDLSNDAIDLETKWLQGDDSSNTTSSSILHNTFAFFGVGVVCGIIVFLAIIFVRRRGLPWRRGRGTAGPSYQRVSAADAWEFDEAKLDDLPPARTHRRGFDDSNELPDDTDDDDSDERARHNRTPSTGESSAG